MNKVSLKVEVQSKASEYSLQYCIRKYLEEAGFDNVVVEPLKVQESGWININVRMPEFEGDYYVTDGHKEPWKCRMMKFRGVKGWINSANNPAIKYWLQMPELPKEV